MAQMENHGAQSGTNTGPEAPSGSPVGAICEPKGSQGTKMRAQRGPNGSQWGPHGSPKGPKLEPKSPQERKIGKVKNTRSQKVEKLKNHENLKITKVEMLIFHSFYNEN